MNPMNQPDFSQLLPKDTQPTPAPIPDSALQEEYQKALLRTGIQAANLLSELIALKIMPDPRAKEMADVALEVIRLIDSKILSEEILTKD